MKGIERHYIKVTDDNREDVAEKLGMSPAMVDLYSARWDVTWGERPVQTKPWPRFKAKWSNRISGAWAVLTGKRTDVDWDDL